MEIQFRGLWNHPTDLRLTVSPETTLNNVVRFNKIFKDWCLREYLPRERLVFYNWPFEESIRNCIRLIKDGKLLDPMVPVSELGNGIIINVIGRRINCISMEELDAIRDNQDLVRLAIIHADPGLTIVKSDQDISAAAHSKQCIVCFEHDANVCLKNCGHLVMCWNCVNQLKSCPLCGRKYDRNTDVLRIYQ